MNKIFSKIAVFAVGAAMAVGVGVAASRHVSEVKAEETTVTYVFGSKTWEAKVGDDAANWTSNKEANGFTAGQGVQVTGGKSGAGATSPTSFENVTKVLFTYNTNFNAGAGTLNVTIGEGAKRSEAVAYDAEHVGSQGGKNANYQCEFVYSIPETGNITFTTDVTTNSIWVLSVAVTYGGEYIDPRTEVELSTVEAVSMNALGDSESLPSVTNKDTSEAISGCIFTPADPEIVKVADGKLVAVNSGTTTVEVSKEADEEHKYVKTSFEVTVSDSALTSKLSFAAKCEGAGTASDGNAWTITSDAAESVFDEEKGIHYGTSNLTVQNVTLESSSYTDVVKRVVVNATDATAHATVSVTVGGVAFTCDATSVGMSPSAFVFTGSAKGAVVVTVARPEAEKKAIYVKYVNVYGIADTDPAISVSVNKTSLAKGETATITTTLNNGATGTPAYVADNPSLVELLPAADGLTCTVTALSATETTVVTITVSLEGCESKTVQITIQKDAVITGITIKTQPTKLTYYVGDTIDLTGIAVVKVYDDESEEPVAIEDLDVAADLSAVAVGVDVTLTLKGTTHEAHFKVDVVEKPAPAGITVAQALALLAEVPTPTEAKATNYVVDAETSHEVTGFLTDIGSWNATSKLGSFYLATELGGTTKLQVFCREASKAVFDAAVAAKAGAEVTVTGVLGVYSKDGKERAEEIVTPSALVVVTPAPEEEVLNLTIAEALARGAALAEPEAGKSTEDTVKVKVSGIVTKQGTWSSTYNNGDFYIGATAEATAEEQLVVFRFDDKDIFDQCRVGAVVEATGTLALFKNKTTSALVVELTKSTVTITTPAPEEEILDLTIAEALARGAALAEPEAGKSTEDTVKTRVSGIVARQMTWSSTYNNGDVYIGATMDAPEAEQLDIFRISDKDKFDQCKVGAEIEVVGKLALFKHKTSGALIVELTNPEVTIKTPAPELDPIEVDVAGAHEAAKDVTPVPGSTVKVDPIQEYAVTGYVKNVQVYYKDPSAEVKEFNYAFVWIVDDLDTKTAPEVQLYSVNDETIFNSIKATGTQIKATGLLGVYQQKTDTEPKLEVINPVVEKIADPVVTVKSLSYEGTPKTTYEIGDSLDLSGITKIIVTYSDSTEETPHTKEVALADCTVSGFDSTTAGNKVVKVAYTEDDVEVSFNIMVKVNAPVPPEPEDPTVVGISVLNEKTEYEVGDTFDLNALTVTLDMSDDSEVAGVLGTNYTIEGPEGFDGTFRAAGTFTFTVVALEDESVTASFTVTVTAPEPPAPTLVSITVTTTVTEYNVGDVIDKSTLTVTATYSDGSTAVIAPEEYTVAFDSSTAAEEIPVTVTYQGKTYTFTVKVNALAPAKKGCGGEIVTTSIILSTLSLAGVALLSLKKKKED